VVSGFGLLHPAVQYQVVNALGWASLRPLQEEAVRPLRDGQDVLLVAPTAGGKTEAALLPLLSRMAGESWRGLSVLYIAPLKALLNNVEPRISQMAAWLGRRAVVWHGDVAGSAKRAIIADPPDILLTTPESIEGMLLGSRVEHGWFYADLRAVVVDEAHAFAGADRGWHLIGVLARLNRVAGRPVQRVGLSATVGNPAAMLAWLADGSPGPRAVVAPAPAGAEPPPEVGIDHVGSIGNAAHVIAALHRGEKRLAFCDSRAQCEQLAVALREREVRTFVSHSSLSPDERRQTERAVAEAADCVIVATSTLELDIDIGDLDRVIQIDAPTSVASFLQRLGRTGRRPDAARNTLFLATSTGALWLAVALTLLWQRGFVEESTPPTLPRHIVAQQLLGLLLQEKQLVRHEVWPWLGGLAAVPGADAVLAHLVAEGFLVDEGGLVAVGPKAEHDWGRRYFRDLTSSFTSERMLEVVLGRQVLGYLPPLSLAAKSPRARPVVLLGGRAWEVTHIDWPKLRAHVERSQLKGRSRWNSGGRSYSYALARAHHDVLAGADPPSVALSARARRALADLRDRHDFAAAADGADRTYLVDDRQGPPAWWTFAGFAANSGLAGALPAAVDPDAAVGELRLRLRPGISAEDLRRALDAAGTSLTTARAEITDESVRELKFSAAVPVALARETLAERLADVSGVAAASAASVREHHR
jgi:ATP-dependent helicase Lhr and Lhr-like helicase